MPLGDGFAGIQQLVQDAPELGTTLVLSSSRHNTNSSLTLGHAMQHVALATWFRRRAERDGAKDAITFDGTTLTFGRVQEDIEAFADLLAASGVNSGDRVAYVGFNHSRFLIAL